MSDAGVRARSVIVTPQVPLSAEAIATGTHGGYQRLGVLIEVAAAAAGRVTLIAVVRAAASELRVSPADLEAFYGRLSGVPVRVSLLHLPSAGGTSVLPQRLRAAWGDPHALRAPLEAAPPADLARARALLGDAGSLVLLDSMEAFELVAHLGWATGPTVLDLDDIEHRALLRLLRLPPHYPGKLVGVARVAGLVRAERRALSRCTVVLACSAADRQWMARSPGGSRLQMLPNVVAGRAPLPLPASRNALFVGSLAYGPNTDAASWLIRDIWPHVLRACPDATLTIAGGGHDQVPGHQSAGSSVRFTGYVEALEPLYGEAQVVLCPIRAGGGTRLKIIEAAMYGRPVVATPLGAEGLEFSDPREIRLRAGAADLASECVRLLRSPDECTAVGSAAHDRAAARYARERVVREVGASLRDLMHAP